MVQIGIRYYGSLREIIGKRSEKVTIDDSSTLMDLLERLSNIYGSKFRNFVFGSDGKVRQGIAFAINGDNISASNLRKIKCKKISEFVILPPISGGIRV